MEMLHVFADMCQAYGVDEIIAVATSAVRDAENGEEFLNRVREETGLNIRIISGREEARLIWRGVSSGMEKSDELKLFVDIGGRAAGGKAPPAPGGGTPPRKSSPARRASATASTP